MKRALLLLLTVPCLSAAIVAHDQGASCVVLEKAGKLGGLSGFGGGEVFVPANKPMLALGLADTKEVGRQYYEFIGAGFQSRLRATLGNRHFAGRCAA